MPVIKVSNLTKQFKDIKAVDDLSFTVNEGEIYGFLGQNGAGKSTTIRMMLTLIEPTSGHVEIFGKDLRKHRTSILKRVGAIIERPDLYKYLTAIECLRIFANISGAKCTKKMLMDQLEMVGLADRADSKVKTYSQGMKQRLGIAVALVHDPGLIILDEPINGLDPQGIADIRNLVLDLSRNKGKTIFISSHLLSEIQLIADSMLIIDKGRKMAEGKVADLFDPARALVELIAVNPESAWEKLSDSNWRTKLEGRENEKIFLRIHKDQIPMIAKDIVNMDIGIIAISEKHSLEDYFLSLTTANKHVEAFKN